MCPPPLDDAMDPARWEEVQALFHHTVGLPPAAGDALLDATARNDPDLAAQVRRMLAADAGDGSLLDRPLGHVAHELLATPAADVPVPGIAFGPYRLVRLLGEGGVGVVYLAERSDLGSRAAIKVLRDAWLAPSRRERFAIEQRVLARLNHPGIARLYDAGSLPDGTPWIAMEYVDGVTFSEYCAKHGCSLAERLRLFREVCEAVQYAHRELVIHRDLKPSNLLVTAEGRVKLLDFGIAKQLESLDPALDATRTGSGLRPMTAAYAAPEQIRGEPVGTYTDVHALGLLLYEFAVDRPAFNVTHSTPAEAATIVASTLVPRPSLATATTRAPRGLWADVDVLCLTAAHKAPERRYQTVDALIRDVDHALRGEPLDARPDSRGYRFSKFLRRHARAVTAAAIAAAALVGVVTAYTIRLAEARDTAVAEAARTDRIRGFMQTVFRGGDEMVGPADSLKVVTVIDRGLRETPRLRADPAVHAEVLSDLAQVYLQLGRIARADSLVRVALAERRAHLGPTHPGVVSSLAALAQVQVEAGRLDEAERAARDAWATSQAHLVPTHRAAMQATLVLGQVLNMRAKPDSAVLLLQEAVRRQRTARTSEVDLSEALNALAMAQHNRGELDAADSINLEVLAMSRRLYGDAHPAVAYDLMNLGAARAARGDYAKAEQYYRAGVRIFAGWFGAGDYRTARAESQLAQALINLGQRDEARVLLRRVLASQERIYGPVSRLAALARNRIGLLALKEGDVAMAEQEHGRALAIYRQIYRSDHWDIASTLGNLANTAAQEGEQAQAEAYMREALAMSLRIRPADHPDVGIERVKLGRILTRQKRWAEAEAELRAGYAIVAQKSSPSSPWIKSAREDLVRVYQALGRPDEANRYRAQRPPPNAHPDHADLLPSGGERPSRE